jgi:hypothetical protein
MRSLAQREVKPAESHQQPSLSPKELRAIEQDTQQFLTRFASVHASAIACNTVAVRSRLVRLIVCHFRLKRGPKPDALIVKAHELLQQGAKRCDLLRSLIQGFDTLDTYGQHLVRKSFYAKLRRYEQLNAL